jgi:hypothetical protein
MKKLLLILLCLPFIGFGQNFELIFGGGENEFGNSVQQTTDGGYIITGNIGNGGLFSGPSGNFDIYLLKTDANGIEQWNQTFGGINTSEEAYSVQQTSDGGYIIAGYRTDTLYISSVWLIKTDNNGNTQWEQTFIDSLSSHRAYSIQQTTDGGYIISGNASGGSFLLKTDINGQEQWTEYYNGYGYKSQQTSDGGYILMADDGGDYQLIKTDTNGIEQWNQTTSVGGGDGLRHGNVEQTSDGGYVIITDVEGVGINFEGLANCIIKTDANGIEQWVQCYDTSPLYSALGFGNGQQTFDGGYIMSGVSLVYDYFLDSVEWDLYLLKTDANGVEQWRRTFGDIGTAEVGLAVEQTIDGGYVITGYKALGAFEDDESDIYLIKTDGNGNATFTLNIPINPNRKLEKTVDILGKETKPQTNTPLIEIYDDGTVEKRIVIE